VEPQGEIPHLAVWTGLFLLAGLTVAARAPLLGNQILVKVERIGARFAERKHLAIASVFLAAVIVRLILLLWVPVPVPQVHDEFSYLLAGDTFAHGRLTNPPHPMWIYFDTFHVNQQPTYMSIYPPAQGAVLALGQVLGHPWIGVLLSTAAMCAAILWALQGWFPARWAFLGGILAVLRLAVFGYWINSYWGGTVAAFAGALVIGALPRITRFARRRDAVILGVGAALLANSRPFEGLVFCLPVAVALLYWLPRDRGNSWEERFRRVLLPLGAVGALCLAFDAYYNWRGTGDPFVLPYILNVNGHFAIPQFVGQRIRPSVQFQNAQFDAYYNKWWHLVAQPSGAQGILETWVYRARNSVRFFLWPELCLPMLTLPWFMRDRRVRPLIWQCGTGIAGSLLVVLFFPHYAAPYAASMFALVTQGFRHLRNWRPGNCPVGTQLARVVFVFALILVPFHLRYSMSFLNMDRRTRIIDQLNVMPGQHLVIVRYSPHHNAHQEWVYNRADIDRAKIVWAREIPGVSMAPLLAYFQGCQVWLLEPDESATPSLSPYPSTKQPEE
jgi:hypothetical protein